MPSQFGAVILAAGLGKRMRSKLPKVLHEIAGKPLLYHVLKRVQEVAPHAPIGIVVGYARESVEAYIRQEPQFSKMQITFIFQSEQKGTGHAAQCAMESSWGKYCLKEKLPILVLPGDLPLISTQLLEAMTVPLKKGEGLRLLTCELAEPTGYGRVIRAQSNVLRIVEEKDANPKERMIREVAVSIYFFDVSYLSWSLGKLSNKNAQGEYYLTDTIELAKKAKKTVAPYSWKNTDELRGVNDLWELCQAGKLLNESILRKWAILGVRFMDPSSTWIDATVELTAGVRVASGAILSGMTRVGADTEIGSGVVLKDVVVGEQVTIKVGTVAEKSQIGSNSNLGPYAHLRPESVVGSHVKIGNFVELKKARVGDNTSIAHLSYVGDAEIGKNVNIGCGFVTCNFDGRKIDGNRKHKTVIEDEVFLGSDCQTVAPVKVGKGAYVASGSTITEDVPSQALAIARSRQVNKLGYAEKLRDSK